MELDKNNLCVYIHKDVDGIVRYVGHGTLDRAKESTKTKRSPSWLEIFKDYKPIVEIVSIGLDYTTAVKIENSLIEKYSSTVCNKNKSSVHRLMSYSLFSEYFVLDSTSPSGLRWKKDVKSGKKKSGDIAGYILDKKNGKFYWCIHFNKTNYKVHRIVWVLSNTQDLKEGLVDHIDGNGLNNDPLNLRLASYKLNSRNKAIQSNNSLGEKNIREEKTRFIVYVYRNGFSIRTNILKRDFKTRELALEEAKKERDFIVDNYENILKYPQDIYKVYGKNKENTNVK